MVKGKHLVKRTVEGQGTKQNTDAVSGRKSSRRASEGVRSMKMSTRPLIHKAVVTKFDTDMIHPVSSPAILELTKAEVKQACVALRLKQRREKQGRRQYGRRLLSEPYLLSDSQKIIFANCYKAARNEERPVDNVRMSNSCHFSTFGNHAQMLAAMEKDIVAELREALMEQRAIEAGRRVRTTAEWEDELARVQTLHQEQVGNMEGQVEKLTRDLVNGGRENSDLRTQLAGEGKENQRLRLQIRTTASYLQRLVVKNQP